MESGHSFLDDQIVEEMGQLGAIVVLAVGWVFFLLGYVEVEGEEQIAEIGVGLGFYFTFHFG